MTIEVHDEA